MKPLNNGHALIRCLILNDINILTTGVMPNAPSALTVTMVTATSITITWTQSSDIFIDRYEVSLLEGVLWGAVCLKTRIF